MQTVAVLMKTKERAADVGTAERRILRPNQAMKMALMSSDRRADFERRVQEAVGQITYATKRRYERRQERLDKAGIFHPEANAHRSYRSICFKARKYLVPWCVLYVTQQTSGSRSTVHVVLALPNRGLNFILSLVCVYVCARTF